MEGLWTHIRRSLGQSRARQSLLILYLGEYLFCLKTNQMLEAFFQVLSGCTTESVNESNRILQNLNAMEEELEEQEAKERSARRTLRDLDQKINESPSSQAARSFEAEHELEEEIPRQMAPVRRYFSLQEVPDRIMNPGQSPVTLLVEPVSPASLEGPVRLIRKCCPLGNTSGLSDLPISQTRNRLKM
jgi:hypothetical protein